MALTFSTSQISLIAFVMHPMECRLDPASEPFDVFSETAITRYQCRPTRGQPPSLTAPSASSLRTYKPARDDVRPSSRFSLIHHHPPLPPLHFSENAHSEGICDPSWFHKRGRCRHHPARVHVLFHSPCDVDSAHHESTYSTTSQHCLDISSLHQPSR